LLQAESQAKARQEEVSSLVAAKFREEMNALKALRLFDKEWAHVTLTPAGLAKRRELIAAGERAERERKEIEDLETQCKIEGARPEMQTRHWCYAERNRIESEEREKQKAKRSRRTK